MNEYHFLSSILQFFVLFLTAMLFYIILSLLVYFLTLFASSLLLQEPSFTKLTADRTFAKVFIFGPALRKIESKVLVDSYSVQEIVY